MKNYTGLLLPLFILFHSCCFGQDWFEFRSDSFRILPLDIKILESDDIVIIGTQIYYPPNAPGPGSTTPVGNFLIQTNKSGQLLSEKFLETAPIIYQPPTELCYSESNNIYLPYRVFVLTAFCDEDSIGLSPTFRRSLMQINLDDTTPQITHDSIYNLRGYCEQSIQAGGILYEDSLLVIDTKETRHSGNSIPYTFHWYGKSGQELSKLTYNPPNFYISQNKKLIRKKDRIIIPGTLVQSDTAMGQITRFHYAAFLDYCPKTSSFQVIKTDLFRHFNNLDETGIDQYSSDENEFLISFIEDEDFNGSNEDFFLVKMNLDFEVVWEKQFDEPVSKVRSLPDGKILIFQKGIRGSKQFKITLLNPSGVVIREKIYTEPNSTSYIPRTIQLLNDNNCFAIAGDIAAEPDAYSKGEDLSMMIDCIDNLEPVSTEDYFKNNKNTILFPNPSKNKVQIDFSKIKEGFTNFQLYNASGKLIFTKGNLTKNQIINLQSVDRGFYFYKIETSDFSYSGKLIKL